MRTVVILFLALMSCALIHPVYPKKKTGPPAKIIENVEDFKGFVKFSNVAVVGFFKDQESTNAKTFLNVAREFDDIHFAITSDYDVFTENNVSRDEAVVMLKKFDERRSNFIGDFAQDSIRKFIQSNRLPLVTKLTPATASNIFSDLQSSVESGEKKTHLLLFASQKASDYKKVRSSFAKAAVNFKGRVRFIFINTDVKDFGVVKLPLISAYFGLKEADYPTVRLAEKTAYKPDFSDLNEENISNFVTSYLQSDVKTHLMSEEVPSDWDAKPVKVLVGKNFNQIARDKSKAVLVEVYAPWSDQCKQLAPIYDQLGENFKDHPDIIIAKMDATANELEDLKIDSFPTIKYFPKHSDEVVDFNGERTLEGLSKFLNSGGKVDAGPTDKTAEEVKVAEEAVNNASEDEL